jgi:hypothetical protein
MSLGAYCATSPQGYALFYYVSIPSGFLTVRIVNCAKGTVESEFTIASTTYAVVAPDPASSDFYAVAQNTSFGNQRLLKIAIDGTVTDLGATGLTFTGQAIAVNNRGTLEICAAHVAAGLTTYRVYSGGVWTSSAVLNAVGSSVAPKICARNANSGFVISCCDVTNSKNYVRSITTANATVATYTVNTPGVAFTPVTTYGWEYAADGTLVALSYYLDNTVGGAALNSVYCLYAQSNDSGGAAQVPVMYGVYPVSGMCGGTNAEILVQTYPYNIGVPNFDASSVTCMLLSFERTFIKTARIVASIGKGVSSIALQKGTENVYTRLNSTDSLYLMDWSLQDLKTSGYGTYFTVKVNGIQLRPYLSELPSLANFFGDVATNAGGSLSVVTDRVPSSANGWRNQMPLCGAPCSIATIHHTVVAAGGQSSIGSYSYLFCYKYSENGKVWRSPPRTISVTISVNNSLVNLWVFTPPLNYPEVEIEVYRTQVNGSQYYFLKNITWYPTSATPLLVDNSTPDATLATYTPYPFPLPLLESGYVPLANYVAFCRNRLFLVAGDEKNKIYFSKYLVSNEYPSFNESLQVLLPGGYGEVVAVAEMDEKIIVFKEYAIYMFYGEGPDDTGTGSFSTPQLITSSVGCRDTRSIVLADAGLMFMSYEGIYILSRGLQTEYVGSAVEQYNTNSVTGSENLADRHQIWFTTIEGNTLVYDEFFKMWYVFTGLSTRAFSSVRGNPQLIRYDDGYYLSESAGTYNDAGTTFSLQMQTGWVTFANIMGFQRFRSIQWLGSSTNTVLLNVAYDYTAASVEQFTVTTSIGTPWQFQAKPARQKCEAIQITLSCASITGAVYFNGFNIEAGIRAGQQRVPMTKRVQGV